MGKKKDLIGITKEMKCGVKGTIIWTSEDRKKLDIEFENGLVMKNKSYISFYGKALNPLNPRLEMCKDGYIFTSNQGDIVKVIDVIDSRKILVEFQDEEKYQKYIAHKEVKNGSVFNPYHKNVYGVGYLGMEIPIITDKLYNKCYTSWHGMIERSFSEKFKTRQPVYKDCTSCKEWENYANFKKWFDENYYEIDGKTMNLDKDILVKGNKIYSPDTCVFVPTEINALFTKTNKFRGEFPIGVYYKKKLKKYIAQCSEIQSNGKKAQTHIGVFNTPEEAFYAYKEYKEKVIKKVADEYKEVIPNKLYEALYKWEVDIND